MDLSPRLEVIDSVTAGKWARFRIEALRLAPEASPSDHANEQNRISEIEESILPEFPRGHFVVGAFLDGEIVGCLGLTADKRPKVAHKGLLWGAFVHPEYRRCGIGRALFTKVIEIAEERTALKLLTLWVNAESQNAISLYRSLGFKEYGRHPCSLIVNGREIEEVFMVLGISGRSF